MDVPRIQIQQGYSKIGMEQVKGQLSIEQRNPTLNMHQQSGDLEMNSTAGNLDIDQSKAWSALGLARSIEMMDRIAQNAMESSMQNIAEIAQAGDRMMAIQNKGSVFADLAYQSLRKDRYMEFRGPVSYDNVDISYTPRIVDITYIPSDVSFDPEYNKPTIEYTPGNVNVYIDQKNYINFSTTGTKLDAVV